MNERSIFLSALGIEDPKARQEFLNEACGVDAQMREQVERLLLAHELAMQHLGSIHGDEAEGVDLPPPTDPYEPSPHPAPQQVTRSDELGTVLASRYKLIQKLGEGGMGTVYLADQFEPVRRKVAVKVIKAGMESAQVLARFEAERQALAVMDHANIAKVFDAGVTSDHRPFFVMELVKGVPITRFCDQEHLSPRERLELFVPVCQAVQHAHQKGVIHRDLKPSNVLIALYDGKPMPKVIDFGVAKAVHRKLTEDTVHTEIGSIIGTLEYMAPEQAELNNLDIDTRADIYSLGVILYELLTGSPPFTHKQLRSAAFTEMLRMIREIEPPKPSTRLSSSHDLPSIAANRKLEPRRLTHLVHGDLDWIVMKALAKERSLRYETANGFAADIQRYLADEPVSAGPPSATYRIRKFIRRHRGLVIAASIVFLSLVAGITGTTLGLFEANRQKVIAFGERDEKEKARKNEEQERKYAQAIADFVRRDFLALTSVEGQYRFGGPTQPLLNRNTTLRDLLERASAKLFHRKDLDPRSEAELHWMIGVNFRGIGEFARSLEELEKCVALRVNVLGPAQAETLDAQNSLGVTLMALDRSADAIKVFEQLRKIREAQQGPNHRDVLLVLANLAYAYEAHGEVEYAIQLLEQVRRVQESTRGPDHDETLVTLGYLAHAYFVVGNLNESIKLNERVLAVRVAKLKPDHPDLLDTLDSLGAVYRQVGRVPEAMKIHENLRAVMESKFGPNHPELQRTLLHLAMDYRLANRLPEAIKILEQLRAVAEKKNGSDHRDTLDILSVLGKAYADARRFPEAITLMEKVRAAWTAQLGPEHVLTLTNMQDLAEIYMKAGRIPDAIQLSKDLYAVRQAKLGPNNPETITALNNLGVAYWSAKQLDKSIPLFEEALRRETATKGPDDPSTLHKAVNLGVNYRDAGQLDKAIPLLEDAYRRGKSHGRTGWISAPLLPAYYKAGKNTEARYVLLDQLVESRKALTPGSAELAADLAATGIQLQIFKYFADAEPILRECLALREKIEPNDWTTSYTRVLLGQALRGQKRYADAEPLLLDGYSGMKNMLDRVPKNSLGQFKQALEYLVRHNQDANQPEDAAKWQKMLDEMGKR